MDTRMILEVDAVRGPVQVVDPQTPLSRLATRDTVVVAEDCPIGDAVQAMRRNAVSAVLVGDRAGIVTERDVVRALATGVAAADAVASIATRHPLGVPGRTTVLAAAALMLNEHVRHLLVELDSGGVGIVSMRDLLAVLLQAVDPQLWLTSLRLAIEAPSEIWVG